MLLLKEFLVLKCNKFNFQDRLAVVLNAIQSIFVIFYSFTQKNFQG